MIKTLLEILDKENRDQKQKTYFKMNGASYHVGKDTNNKKIKNLQVPTIKCSPYSP